MSSSKFFFGLCLCVAALLLAAAATGAAEPGVWSTGGPYGGPIVAIAVAPSDRSFVLAATGVTFQAPGRLFASHDGGKSWAPLNLSDSLAVRCLTIDPVNSEVVYAGIDPSDVATHVSKSTDGGSTWTSSSFGQLVYCVQAIVVDPTNTSIVYAATSQGVYKSADGGGSWSAKSSGLPDIGNGCGFAALVLDPAVPSTLYFATDLPAAVYKSTNGGASWHPASTGLPPQIPASLAIDPFNAQTLLISSAAGIFKSTNGGQSWSSSLSTPNLPPGETGIVSIAFDPAVPQHVVALSSSAEFFESADAGISWSRASTISNVFLPGSIVYTSAGIAFNCRSGFVLRSDSDPRWLPSNLGILGVGVSTVVTDLFQPGKVFAIDSLGALYRTFDNGGSWLLSDSHFPGNLIVPDPSNRQLLYAAGGHTFVYRSSDGGDSWQAIGRIVNDDDRFHAPGIEELVIDPISPEVLYAVVSHFGNSTVFRSADGGVTWSVTGSAMLGGSVHSLAIDPSKPATLYAVLQPASGGGGYPIFKSSDSGSTWDELFGVSNAFFDRIAVDPRSPTTLYASATAPDAGNGVSIYRSSDAGSSWGAVTLDLNGALTSSLIVSPKGPNDVFLSSVGGGVFRSEDGGRSWHDISDSLPDRNVFSLALDPTGRFLHAATDTGVYELLLPGSSDLCTAGPETLCLLSGRFSVSVSWQDQHAFPPTLGAGTALPETDESGYFWFFSPQSVELAVKILDGTAVNGKFWVFYGALSDVEYTITVTDNQTGEVKTYHNEPGNICGGADTSAFSGIASLSANPAQLSAPPATVEQAASPAALAPCAPSATSLCLLSGRFKVSVAWVNQHSPGAAGVGKTVSDSDQSGDFWFFSPGSVELVVKMVDGAAVNGNFWVFYGALSDVEYTITVTDTQTGAVRTYHNDPGNICGGADTSAF